MHDAHSFPQFRKALTDWMPWGVRMAVGISLFVLMVFGTIMSSAPN